MTLWDIEEVFETNNISIQQRDLWYKWYETRWFTIGRQIEERTIEVLETFEANSE